MLSTGLLEAMARDGLVVDADADGRREAADDEDKEDVGSSKESEAKRRVGTTHARVDA